MSDRWHPPRRLRLDQRIEVLGGEGALHAENVVESTVVFHGPDGIVGDKPLPFFLERYAEAYRHELDHFIQSVAHGAAPLVGGPRVFGRWRWLTPNAKR